MSSNYMGDVSAYINSLSGTTGAATAAAMAASNNASNNMSLTFEDILNLMVVQLQNQTMDDTVDTSDMLNQMIQMQVVQSITDITDATIMTYAASLVGKEVTIVSYDAKGNMSEKIVTITGTGYCNGSQVVFAGDEMFTLNQIAAVGRLPDSIDNSEAADGSGSTGGVEGSGGTTEPGGSEETTPGESVSGSGEAGDTGETDETGEIPGDRPVEDTSKTEQSNAESGEDEEVVDPSAEAEKLT